MRWSMAFYQKNLPCPLAWEVLCDPLQGCPWPKPHPYLLAFLFNFDFANLILIHSNPTKTNENV